MRITTSELFNSAVMNMLDQQTKVAETQQQIATGKKILTPADNPSAAAQVLSLSDSIDGFNQYQSNADAATSRLTVENNALTSVANSLQRASELAIQGLNGTQSAQDRQGIAAEVQQILDNLVSLANTQDSNGEYVFGGYKSTTQPITVSGGTYTYNGDAGQRSVQTGPNQQVITGDPGSKVFMSIPASAGGTQSVFKTLSDLVTDLRNNNPQQASLSDIQSALQNALSVQTEVGARLDAVSSQKDINSNNLLQVQQYRSQLADVDFVQAVSQYNQQLLALQAAQQSFSKLQQLSLFNYL